MQYTVASCFCCLAPATAGAAYEDGTAALFTSGDPAAAGSRSQGSLLPLFSVVAQQTEQQRGGEGSNGSVEPGSGELSSVEVKGDSSGGGGISSGEPGSGGGDGSEGSEGGGAAAAAGRSQQHWLRQRLGLQQHWQLESSRQQQQVGGPAGRRAQGGAGLGCLTLGSRVQSPLAVHCGTARGL